MQNAKFLDLVPIVIYLAIASAFFAPVLASPGNYFLGYHGDIGISIQAFNIYNYNIQNGINSTDTELFNAPFGSNVSQFGNFQPSFIYMLAPLSLATGPLAAYNLMIFFGLVMSAIATYFLARHFIKSRHACFIAGLIYGFSPYLLARAIAGHESLVQGAWIPLFVLALFRFHEERNSLNAILLALAITLVAFFSYYYFFFALIFLVIFYLYQLWQQRLELLPSAKAGLKRPKDFIVGKRHYFLAFIVFALLFLAAIFPSVSEVIINSETSTFRAALGGRTNVMNAVYLSAWPHHLLTPSVYHPLFRAPVSEFLSQTLVGMNFTGATVFVGFTALALSLFALAKMRKDKNVKFFLFVVISALVLATGPFMRYFPVFGLTLTFVPALLSLYFLYLSKRKWARIFAVIFLALLFFPLLYSLIPLVQEPAADLIGLEKLKNASVPEIVKHFEKYSMLPIPMPSLPLFLAVPVFRMLARLVIILMLAIAMLAGFGLQSLTENASPNKKHAITAVVAALVLFEAINFPPYILSDASRVPGEYQWLAEQPGNPITLEYPIEWGDYFYIFYQQYHMKPIMNGGYSAKFAELRKRILDPTDPGVLSMLAGFGVQYIITHDDYFLEQIPDSLPEKGYALNWMKDTPSAPFARELDQRHESIPGIELVKEFKHAKVYRITAEPKEFYLG